MGSHTTALQVTPEDVLPVYHEEPRLGIFQGDLKNGDSPVSRVGFGWLPEGKSPFLDERVRQAVSMSWDRDLWLETFFNVSKFAAEGLPVETRWNSHLNANWDSWWLDPKGKDFGPNAKYFQHDIAEGKKLLAAAGYPSGFSTQSHMNLASQPYGPAVKFVTPLDNMTADVGIKAENDQVDYVTKYIPVYRDGNGQYEGWSWPSISGSGPNTLTSARLLAAEWWPQGGVAFRGFSASGKNDQSGDPALNTIIEKARLEPDVEKQHTLVNEAQRYMAKAMWGIREPGGAARFTMAWPALGNYRVWRGGHWPYYRLWLDQTKPPFAKA